uniref:SUZ domain-containing protein n=1 Tax=Panagrolaimus sp. JU765 TaxID=591449 RepID=A0AC34PZ77_9BILA
MSKTEQCNPEEQVADDWENVGDDALVASVAERQKRLAKIENERATEQEQLKIEQSKSSSSLSEKKNDVGNGPVRLLRRPNSGSQIKCKTDEELAKEAHEKVQKELEERTVAYQQAREKIFGGDPVQSEEVPTTNTGTVAPPQPRILPISVPSTSSSNTKDHLSDVPMKRADVNRQQTTKQIQSFQNAPQPLMLQQPLPPVPPHLTGPWPNFNYPPLPPPSMFIGPPQPPPPPQNLVYNGMQPYYGPMDPFLPNPIMRMPTIIQPPPQRPYQNQGSNSKDRNRRAR